MFLAQVDLLVASDLKIESFVMKLFVLWSTKSNISGVTIATLTILKWQRFDQYVGRYFFVSKVLLLNQFKGKVKEQIYGDKM
jgi:hypothetical protein